jgi:hypothetical protein
LLIFNYYYYFPAAGLYYLAELVEEYTVAAKKVISWMVFFTTTIYVAFIFVDNLSWAMVMFGLASQGIHIVILNNFPYVRFISPSFLVALVLLIINHYLAFIYFQSNYYPFSEVR